MKINFLKIGFYAAMFAMTIFVTACGGGENHDHEGHDHDHPHQHEHEEGHDHDHDHEGHDHQHEQGEEETSSIDKTGKEYTSAYVCPMHCEGSGADVAGKCPVCEMDYEENEVM